MQKIFSMGGDGVGDVHIGLRPYARVLASYRGNPVGVTKKADA